MNSIQLMGRLTRNPEVTYTTEGKVKASFTLAVDRDYVTKGSGAQEVDFIPCVVWGKQAEILGNCVHKGHRLLVSRGALNINVKEKEDGVRHYYTVVRVYSFTFIERKDTPASEYFGAPEATGEEFDKVMEDVNF